ncbi:NhaP-type Na+(K+)/H+ antiporter [Burkholderiales bacterium GJ-E10]|nr:NhaP-type Na+(K+)/H+ antiporter [Burkholderiales bacterium GJ-E10]
MDGSVENVAILLLVAAAVAMLAQRLRMPYATGLVVTGIALAYIPHAPHLSMTRDLIFTVLLPPLIFEAALFLPWQLLRREMPVVVVLATIGILIAAAVTAFGMHWLAGWPPISAALFGALISATDPVSVIALFRQSGIKGRLRILVEAESLFNDATAAVLFGLLLAVFQGAHPTISRVLRDLSITTVGSIACGALAALPLSWLAARTADHLVRITLSLVAAYAPFLAADHLHLSGVLATMTAGLIAARAGGSSPGTRQRHEAVEAFWEVVAFLANSLIFLLIGMHEGGLQHAGKSAGFPAVSTAAIAVAAVLAGRAATIYPLSSLFIATRWRLSMAHQHILFWGGLRGALALALAFGLPTDVPLREPIVTTCFVVVTFSLVMQGVTVAPLLSALGIPAREGGRGGGPSPPSPG